MSEESDRAEVMLKNLPMETGIIAIGKNFHGHIQFGLISVTIF